MKIKERVPNKRGETYRRVQLQNRFEPPEGLIV